MMARHAIMSADSAAGAKRCRGSETALKCCRAVALSPVLERVLVLRGGGGGSEARWAVGAAALPALPSKVNYKCTKFLQ